MLPTSQLLKEASATQHKEAESSTFVSDLMKGELSLADYTRYLANLAWIYEALEEQTVSGDPFPSSEALWDERLFRLPSIEADLRALGVKDWRSEYPASPAVQNYCSTLHRIGGRSDYRLIAHHYTRYLGDLSGGQAISALVARHYGATPEQLSFCAFKEIDNLVRYKENYRALLDGLDLSEDQRQELVLEVQQAFELNKELFSDLGQPVQV
jgi:heme oxygenase